MLRSLALLVVPSVLVAAFSFGITTLFTRDEAAESRWVIWDGRAFSSPEELRGWLRTRGLTYRRWARNHPYAAARLEGREAPPRKRRVPAAAVEEAAPVAASRSDTRPCPLRPRCAGRPPTASELLATGLATGAGMLAAQPLSGS